MIFKRFIAFIIDVTIAAILSLIMSSILSYINVKVITPMIGLFAWATIICKDCFNGMSIGKHIISIQVIDSNTKQIASPLKCVTRNLFYFLSLIDFIVMFFHSKSLRLGDCIIHTEVMQRDVKLRRTNISKSLLAIGYVFIGLIVIEVLLYLRASSLGLFGYLY